MNLSTFWSSLIVIINEFEITNHTFTLATPNSNPQDINQQITTFWNLVIVDLDQTAGKRKHLSSSKQHVKLFAKPKLDINNKKKKTF